MGKGKAKSLNIAKEKIGHTRHDLQIYLLQKTSVKTTLTNLYSFLNQ